MIVVKEVLSKKEKKEFIEFPLKLYKNERNFVPPLYGDEKKIFSKNYTYNDSCETVYYNAYLDGKMVGRISGILQKDHNKKTGEKRIRFTRFDSIDNIDVAKALFNKVENWAKSKGMDTICGPLGFSDLEREGLLIEGFEYMATFEEQYNFSYYAKLIEACGYTKEVDWLEHRLYKPDSVDSRLENLTKMILDKYGLKVVAPKNMNKFLKQYADKMFDLLDVTYSNLYGTVPFTDGMKKMMLSNFKLILKPKYVSIIVDKDDNVVCFALMLPELSYALRKSNGKLTIPCIIKLLKAINNPKHIDLALIGVDPKYAMKGVASTFIHHIQKFMIDYDIEYCETNLNLETNKAILNQWKNFNHIQHKRRRSFIKNI